MLAHMLKTVLSMFTFHFKFIEEKEIVRSHTEITLP